MMSSVPPLFTKKECANILFRAFSPLRQHCRGAYSSTAFKMTVADRFLTEKQAPLTRLEVRHHFESLTLAEKKYGA